MEHRREPEALDADGGVELGAQREPTDGSLDLRVHVADEAPRIAAAHLAHLLDPHERGLLSVAPPFRGVGAEALEPGLARESSEHGLLVTLPDAVEEALRDALQLVGRFHSWSLTRRTVQAQRTPWRRVGRCEGRVVARDATPRISPGGPRRTGGRTRTASRTAPARRGRDGARG